MTPATEAVAIRDAVAADLGVVQDTYAHYVGASTATFDIEPPPLSVWEQRLARALPAQLPTDGFLVATRGGVVVGFAYSSAYRPKAAYASTRETSVYVGPDHGGQGIGAALYRTLLRSLDASGALLVVANVAQPNAASNALHTRFGFTPVGTLRHVGVKFGQPRDVTLWQREPFTGDI